MKIHTVLPALALLAALPAQAQDIKVGAILPYSGVYASIGEEITNAMAMAFEEAGNAVNGRALKIIRADTETKPNVAAAKARELVTSDNVDFLVGPVASSEAMAIRDFVHQSKIPLVMPNAGANVLTGEKCSPYIVRVGFSNDQFVRPTGKWLFDKGVKSAFLLAPDYAAGRELMGGFKKSFTAAGGKIVGEEYSPFGQTSDFGPYLAKVKDAKPDAVFVFYAGSEAINFIKQAADFQLAKSVKITGAAWTVSPLFLPAQGEAAAGFLGSLNYVPALDNPANKAFQAKYQERHKRVASEFGAAGYESGRLIVEALKRTQGATKDKKAVIEAMHKVEMNGPRGPVKIDPATNNVIQNIYMVEARKGAGGKVDLAVVDTIANVKDDVNGCAMSW